MRNFLVFNDMTMQVFGNEYGYDTERGAKIALAALKNRYLKMAHGNEEYAAKRMENLVVGTREDFQRADYMVPTVNMLTGKECMIRKSDKGTCCDPATERYHTM